MFGARLRVWYLVICVEGGIFGLKRVGMVVARIGRFFEVQCGR